MPQTLSLSEHRQIIRDHYLVPEDEIVGPLLKMAGLGEAERGRAQEKAAEFVRIARKQAERSGLIDKFLQEYGLSTDEGVTLMRLAEALLRTPDAATADSLIEDKIEAGDWSSHKGKSPFPIVNFSTRALMLTAAWLDDVEGDDPVRRMASATKNILDRLGEPVIRASVMQAMRLMGEHFVLGQTIDEALGRGEKYSTRGYSFSYDMLGEAALTQADADKYFNDYKGAIAAISARATRGHPKDNPGVSVKLSALHPRYEFAKKERVLTELFERTRELARQAKDANIGFNIDAEEADRLDISLDLIEALMRDPSLGGWDGFGVVVQAYQRRAPFVIDWLTALARETGRRVMVRLVKGAYWDAEIKRAQVMGLESYPVYTRKALTDLSYLACTRKLLSANDVFYPQFATHNALTAATVQEMAENPDDYELQRLHGMGDALHDRLLENGVRSRIYAPVGGHKELLPYLVRRLLENGANSSFVNQLIDPDLSVDDVVADPIAEIAAVNSISNPNIPAPRDHLNGERLAAKGWDFTHPPTVETMTPEIRKALAPVAARPIVNGETRDGVIAAVTNPANTRDAPGSVESASERDVLDACEAAAASAPEWAQLPPDERASIFQRAADLLEERGEHFMRLAVFEAGKSWPDAIAEVREATDFLRYYAARGKEIKSKPLGVVACISPWNFPLAIFLGQVTGALAAGNAVIAKPAGQSPLIGFEAVRLLHEAGVPGSALHFLPGSGRVVGNALVAHPAVQGVVFTGSTATAQSIKRNLTAAGKQDAALIAETGGINAMIIDSTALLEQAVKDTIASAFQSAGQRCSAARLVCVQDDIADRYLEMLSGAMRELRVDDPAKLSTDVGPVIDADAQAEISGHIKRLENEARLIARAPAPGGSMEGSFVTPAAFEIRKISELKEEIFGPVLHICRFKSEDLERVIEEINSLGFGLTLGIHTRIDETMDTIARRARIGNIYVNRNQIGAVVGVQPFGGEGLSGTGPKAGGPHYVKSLTQRPRPDQTSELALSESPMQAETSEALQSAQDAYHSWQYSTRLDIIRSALTQLSNPPSGIADIEDILSSFQTRIELPGPTGESNTLKICGRGVALCLGGDDVIVRQAILALAAGNCVLAPSSDELVELENRLRSAGAQKGVLASFDDTPSRMLLSDDRIRLIAYDGGARERARLELILAERQGPIAPIVSSVDEIWRYATERTLTINTTAAGGDVRLLSLSE